VRLSRTATRGNCSGRGIRDRGMRSGKKKLLTPELSISEDGGRDTALYYFKNGTE